jgi:hypothetical protein
MRTRLLAQGLMLLKVLHLPVGEVVTAAARAWLSMAAEVPLLVVVLKAAVISNVAAVAQDMLALVLATLRATGAPRTRPRNNPETLLRTRASSPGTDLVVL